MNLQGSIRIPRRPRDGKDGKDGNSAPLLVIAESAQIMICNDDNIAETGQTIEIEAKLQNVTGTADFVAKAYNVSGSPISGNITLGGTGNVRTLTNLQWLSTYKKVVITVTLGSLTDVTTIHRLNKPASGGIDGVDGVDAVVGFLTNENITVQASATGVVGSLDTAVGYFRLYSGVTPVTSGITFSRVSQTGCTVTINATTGYYTVNTVTADNATAILKVKYGTLEIEKALTLSKSKAGSKGDTGDKGEDGTDGKDGIDGEPPKISDGYPKTQYAIGVSKTIYPTIGWGEAIIDVTESKPYLWSRQEIKYDSGDTLYTGYLMLTNITPVSYMAGEWDLRVAYTRNDKSYPIVTYKKGTNNRPLYYYPKKEGVIGYEYFVAPLSQTSSGWYKKGDIVWYEDTNEDYPVILGLYKANKDTRFHPSSGDWDNVTADYAPNGVEGQKLWEFADGVELIITEALMANFAKLDSFVFHKGKMFSQEGTLNGVAGSNEYTDEDHEPNFEVNGMSGKVKMKDADIEGTITGSVFTSNNGKVVVDGISNQIVLKDADSDEIRTILSPRKLPLTPSSYFGSSSPTNDVSLGNLKRIYTQNSSSTVDLITIPSGDSSAYQITIPPITLYVDVNHPGGGGGVGEAALPNLADLKVGIYKNGILQYNVSSVWAMSLGQVNSQTFTNDLKSFTIQGSGTWSIRVTHTHTINKIPSSSKGEVTNIDGKAIVAKVVNSSAIGSNGMVIATSGTEYTYMVGDTYEVRRGNVGFRITNDGVQKSTKMNLSNPMWEDI